MIYADYAAHAPLSDAARDTAAAFLSADMLYGNPSSSHTYGERAAAVLDEARHTIAQWMGTPPAETYFTSGGTESSYIGITALANGAAARGKHTILLSAAEHPAVRETCAGLAAHGFRIVTVPLNENGAVTPAALDAAWTADTGLCCIMAAQNETGVVMPVVSLARFAHDRGAAFFTDAVAFAPYRPLQEIALSVDGMSVAAHKCGGPLGVGALYLHRAACGACPITGGGQESGVRGGTESFPLAAVFAAAVREAYDLGAVYEAGRHMESYLREMLPDMVIPGAETDRTGGVHCLVFPSLAPLGVTGENLALSLDVDGIAVSTGAACHSGSTEPSRTLLAMGYAPEIARTMIRLSFGRGSTPEEIGRAAALVVKRVRLLYLTATGV